MTKEQVKFQTSVLRARARVLLAANDPRAKAALGVSNQDYHGVVDEVMGQFVDEALEAAVAKEMLFAGSPEAESELRERFKEKVEEARIHFREILQETIVAEARAG